MVFQDTTRTTFHTDFFLTKMKVTSSGSTAQVLLGCTKDTTTMLGNTDTAMPWAAIPSTHWRTNPVRQITILIFSLPLANSHHHSVLLDICVYSANIHTVFPKVQRGFDIMSHKSQANSTTGNTMYWEKGIGSGLLINTAVIYPDLKVKDFTLGNTQNCSNTSLLFLLSSCTAMQCSLPHFWKSQWWQVAILCLEKGNKKYKLKWLSS